MPDELLDVVNGDDEVIAREMRSIVHARGLLHRGVHVFLVAPDGRLIVQRRSALRPLLPLGLDGSVSEHVKAGESYGRAARRGLEEELGLGGIAVHSLVKFRLAYGPNDNEISTLFEGRAEPGRVTVDPQEVESIHALRLDELEALRACGREKFCPWFVELLRWYRGEPSALQVLRSYKNDHLLLTERGRRR